MNWLRKMFAKLECEVVGHKLKSEVTIKDYELFTIYAHLITCSNCGKLFNHSSKLVENGNEQTGVD